MGALILPIGPIFTFNGNRVTDHNRSELSITSDRIENRKRMADATLRTIVVAKKRQFKCSWSNLPRLDTQTVDGFWGAQSMSDYYDATNGAFTLKVIKGDNSFVTYTVLFAQFDLKISNRSSYTDLHNLDITMDEV